MERPSRCRRPVQHYDPEKDGANDSKRKVAARGEGSNGSSGGGPPTKKRDKMVRPYAPARGALMKELYAVELCDVAHHIFASLSRQALCRLSQARPTS
jgi:hypothetical protein